MAVGERSSAAMRPKAAALHREHVSSRRECRVQLHAAKQQPPQSFHRHSHTPSSFTHLLKATAYMALHVVE